MRSVLSLLLLAACAEAPEPRVEFGAVLERVSTGERVELGDVGRCGDVYDFSRSLWESLVVNAEDPGEGRAMSPFVDLPVLQADSSDHCASYVEPTVVDGQPVRLLRIVPSVDFEGDDWRRID